MQIISFFFFFFFFRRPEGSEARPTHLEEKMSRNPDHIGGYRLALATFDGLESKFGLCLPKFKAPVIPSSSSAVHVVVTPAAQ